MTGLRRTDDGSIFAAELAAVDLAGLADHARTATDGDVDAALGRAGTGGADLADLAALLSPAAERRLEQLGGAAQAVTRRRFGRTIHLFAPLYLSNDCLSTCTYCGFSKDLDVRRRTLTPAEVEREADVLLRRGFRHLLLVSAEHAKAVSPEYLELVLRRLRDRVPSLAVETQTWDRDVYQRLAGAGADGVVIYQETYDRDTYGRVHVAGWKRRYARRLAAAEAVGEAGLRRLGIGALFGLHPDWRSEALALGAHADWLTRRYWRTEVTVAFPRLKDSAAGPVADPVLDDRSLVQLTAAMRLFQPDVGIVLSTREPAWLREGLLPFGVTTMSAGSSTEPGGYEQAGTSERQFAISDERPPAEVAGALRARGYDPVWKDWSPALLDDTVGRL